MTSVTVEVSYMCPNLPAYGGLPALAGDKAYRCPLQSDLVDSIEIMEIRDSG